jgi:hypothetical protein
MASRRRWARIGSLAGAERRVALEKPDRTGGSGSGSVCRFKRKVSLRYRQTGGHDQVTDQEGAAVIGSQASPRTGSGLRRRPPTEPDRQYPVLTGYSPSVLECRLLADRVTSPAGQRPAVRVEANDGEGQLAGSAAEDRSRPGVCTARWPVWSRPIDDLGDAAVSCCARAARSVEARCAQPCHQRRVSWTPPRMRVR